MALAEMSEKWNGIKRTNGNYNIETCYSVYADPADADADSYMCVSGFCIYADSGSELSSILPVTVTVQIDNAATHTFSSESNIHNGAYSPSKNWMPYYATVSSTENIALPGSGVITIHVTVTPNGGSTFSFDETAYRPLKNKMTSPDSMVTGRVHEFTFEQNVPVGALFSSNATLQFAPMINNIPVVGILEYGYVDPYTKVNSAKSIFNKMYFAVQNPAVYVDDIEQELIDNASINMQTRYMSEDFTNGIPILELSASVPLATRDGVDDDLTPELTDSLVEVTGTNILNVGHDAFVHKQSIATITPAAKFKYGDVLAYIQHDGMNAFTQSITQQVFGVVPGQSYENPKTGETETAGNETVGAITISVTGSKWKLQSASVTKYYNVLWYHTPTVSNFTVHRASRSSSSTSYKQGSYYYTKDDFGLYCIVEYTIDIASLDGQNSAQFYLQYGSTTITLPASSSSGYYIFYAGEAAMNVSLELVDVFTPYGITTSTRLSTAGILLDYLAGGKGMAVGKVATRQKTLDIASDWTLLFYNADVGAYNDDTTSQDLIAWMHGIDTRLTALGG